MSVRRLENTLDRLTATLAVFGGLTGLGSLATVTAGIRLQAAWLAVAAGLLLAAAATAFAGGVAATVLGARRRASDPIARLAQPDLWTSETERNEFLRDTYVARRTCAGSDGLTLATYQAGARATARYPARGLVGLYYAALGLAGEAGEIVNKVKKIIRDDGETLVDHTRAAIADELGDALWYCAALAHELGLPLEEIARANLAKLRDRAERNRISGSGDGR